MDDNPEFRELFGPKYGTLSKVLGKGTFGKVFKSKVNDGPRYAVKLEENVELIPNILRPGDGAGSSTREIEIMKLLIGGKHVIQLLDSKVVESPPALPGENNDRETKRPRLYLRYPKSFIVMPRYDVSLYHYLLERGKKGFPAGRVIQMLLTGLMTMQERKVVNCDIKQVNVLVNVAGLEWDVTDLVYADFGSSKYVPNGTLGGSVPINYAPYCTYPGRPLELYGRNGFVTLTTDVFSVACILYEILIGYYLFPDGVKDIFRFHSADDPRMKRRKAIFKRQLNRIMANAGDFYDVWLKMLAIHPSYRPTADEVLSTFEDCPLLQYNATAYVRPDTSDPLICEDPDDRKGSLWSNKQLSASLLKLLLHLHADPDKSLEVLNDMHFSKDTDRYVMSAAHSELYDELFPK